MTPADTLLALAVRAESATGRDQLLGREILLACGFGYVSPLQRWMDPTASLDAAMTLAEDGWYLRAEPRFYSNDGEVRWRAYAIKPDWSRWTPHDDWFEVVGEDSIILAATPALALCAAALRARAALALGVGQ